MTDRERQEIRNMPTLVQIALRDLTIKNRRFIEDLVELHWPNLKRTKTVSEFYKGARRLALKYAALRF